jgi:ATP-dependent DNA helicase RecQ
MTGSARTEAPDGSLAQGSEQPRDRQAALRRTLREALAEGTAPASPGERPADTMRAEYALWRVLHAWSADGPMFPGVQGAGSVCPDVLVLLRQFLRWDGAPLAVRTLHPAVMDALARYGDRIGLRYIAGHLEAKPFQPGWLREAGAVFPLDEAPREMRPRERTPATPHSAEPWLYDRLGFASWGSAAQKEGVWRALTAPARSTTLVALPTGAGKSLCFQALASWVTGLVVVVVPTVALAIDHYRSACAVLSSTLGLSPLYYTADDPNLPGERVIEELRAGRCRLLFTSPEACVSGKLRPVLADAARSGRLDALVIDEAHLADSWGMFFRVDFQVLAALRRQWVQEPTARLRTLLLSATFTRECRRTLRRLFWDEGQNWSEVVSQRLRPELVYYTQVFESAEGQHEAVLDCAWRLPRPAILYTTTRSDARAWTQHLRDEGFRRVACFDGDTPAHERRDLLDRWRDNSIDLMVATSAFGMGVDKPDVRAVVHACLPEDLHRFYQEVGRGGRDGGSAASVLLPLFPRDRDIASGLAPRLLKPETLGRRWKAMWETRTATGQADVWRLRTDAAPDNLYAFETGRRNIAWNKRLLLQLARAGLVQLLDIQVPPASLSADMEQSHTVSSGSSSSSSRSRNDEAPPEAGPDDVDIVGVDDVMEMRPELATVRLAFAPDSRDAEERIRQIRDEELDALRVGFDHMLDYAHRTRCVGRLLHRLYGGDVVGTCSGCPACRESGRPSFPTPWLQTPAVGVMQPTRAVIGDVPSPARGETTRRQFEKLVRRLAAVGVRRFLCSAEMYPAVLRSVSVAHGGLYRVDRWDAGYGVHCAPDEILAVLHAGMIDDGMLRLAAGARVYHLLTEGTPPLDHEGRRPLERDGVPFYPSPDFWLP